MQIRDDLAKLASQVMRARGLEPEFSKEALQQLSEIHEPAFSLLNTQDLRGFAWCSIDNDTSRDLDQLTYAEKTAEGKSLLWIAIADVGALVEKDSAIDRHAQINTTSVYTPARIFSMLPEKLSTDLTSLNEDVDRQAIVVRVLVNQEGTIEEGVAFQAIVHNYAKLTYSQVGGWLEQRNPAPEKVKQVAGLEESLKVHHETAQRLKQKRHEGGALTLESPEPRIRITEDHHVDIKLDQHNFAHQIIEEFMIAANQTIARYFSKQRIPSFRRIVRIPKSWDRIVEVAKSLGEELPREPDSKALEAFLVRRQEADQASFPDLSLTIIKLLGRGEYVVENAEGPPSASTGHFALALSNYTHFTAPNRRFPDLLSQRQYSAFVRGEKAPYTLEELTRLAAHCTQQEDAAMKVERQLNKSAAAALLSSQIGTVFQGIVTGAGEKGTWVRLSEPPIEGRVSKGFEGLQVGDKISVRLIYVEIAKGWIDFARESR